MSETFQYEVLKPPLELTAFIDSFWMVSNQSDQGKDIVVLPDGNIDMIFPIKLNKANTCHINGLEDKASAVQVPANFKIYAVSFKLAAVEYLLNFSIAPYFNKHFVLSDYQVDWQQIDFRNLTLFAESLSKLLMLKVNLKVESRKMKMFDLIYQSKGNAGVQDIAEAASWSSRQINRYFNQWFGLSLKAYCNILRFRGSFSHLKQGKLFPESDFTDQAHFIKEIKRYSEHTPKQLFKNQDDRFIQLSVME